MKILVIQLARFGDIYLTWPTLRALSRKFPEAEIHLLVREKFLAATEGLTGIRVHALSSASILGPLLSERPDLNASESALTSSLSALNLEWDQIYNLSFSPMSSYLTDFLSQQSTVVKGYTRHADGFLNIPDDASAYFYAQVGIGRDNRFHLADIFAMIADVELERNDWGYRGALPQSDWERPYVVVHLGASQSEKRYPLKNFRRVLRELSSRRVYLVGSKDEKKLAESLLDLSHVKSLIGETSLSQLFALIANADLVIGADSAPVHISAHTGTKVLNLSFASVNFWETGPISDQSVVIHAETPEELAPETVIQTARAMLSGKPLPNEAIVLSTEPGPRFQDEVSFGWKLIQALYTHADYPTPTDSTTVSGVKRLLELTEMALEQLSILKQDLGSKSALQILSVVDSGLTQIASVARELAPLIRWFETERLRMPPQDVVITFKRTRELFENLQTIAQVLAQGADPNFHELQRQGLERLREIENELPNCAMSFRLYQTAKAEPMLQRLLNHLTFFDSNGLHHAGSTKVQSGQQVILDWVRSYRDYREVLNQLIVAFQKQDYVYVADLIEYEISDCLSNWRTQLVKFDTSMLA